MPTRSHHRGYTLFELIVVMVILVLLAVIILPSVGAFRGDSRPRAAADLIRGELAIARARAKQDGQPYRIAISEDGKRIRRAPDTPNFAEMNGFGHSGGSVVAVDYPFEHVTAQVVVEPDMPPPESANGWVTLATVQPDGTCREISILVMIQEADNSAVYLRIRGLTGSSRIVPNPNYNTNTSGGTQ